MKIHWMGHSCFAIETEDGTRIVTDPFDGHVGYPMPWGRADIVTISHGHGDHNHAEPLRPTHRADEAKEYVFGGVRITGIPSFHDDQQGAKRGKNVIFVIEADGKRVAHLGDLGHPLSAEQIAAIGKLDALMIPVGGFYTIDGETAAAQARALSPKVVLPMHYKTDCMNFPISDEQPFLKAYGTEYERRDSLTVGENCTPVVLLNLAKEE